MNKKKSNEEQEEEQLTMRDIRAALRNIEKSMNFINEQFEQFKNENTELKKTVSEVKKENEQLKIRIRNLETNNEKYEQETIKQNIVITGVPTQKEKEDVKITVTRVLTGMGKRIEHHEIEECYRKTIKYKDAPIIVKLKTKQTKDEILERRKTIKSIKTDECGLNGKVQEIYINEQLTHQKNNLFYQARLLKKDGMKYVWVKEGNVYVKKEENTETIKIRTMEDIEAVKTKLLTKKIYI